VVTVRAVLLSRYPRVDTMPWKQRVGTGLLDAGEDVAVAYTDASVLDQALAGVRAEGVEVVRRYLSLRGGTHADGERARSLAEWAAEHGVPVSHIKRLNDPEALRRLKPDIVVLVGAAIVPAEILTVPRLGTINAHYGLLPQYRGMNVTEWSVLRGDPVGVTVHLVDAGIDTGASLLQRRIPIARGETFATLRRKHQDAAAELLVQAAIQLRDGTALPQAQHPDDGRQYYRMHPAVQRVAEAQLAIQTAGAP
jgi:methionyl-tRNA formyltransferase